MCDGKNDCMDGEDEMYCGSYNSSSSTGGYASSLNNAGTNVMGCYIFWLNNAPFETNSPAIP